MAPPKVLVTNVTHYTGPGIVPVLVNKGYDLYCHDPSFTNEDGRISYEKTHQATALKAQSPEDIYQECLGFGRFLHLIMNDVFPNQPKPVEEIDPAELRAAHEALVTFPLRLVQAFIPALKEARSGALVFVTSARQLQPEPGFAIATSVRAGATAMALSIARELAPFDVPVNVLQPNYLYSELYYPKAKFIDDPAGRAEIAQKVPMGRLGQPEEFGELVAFYISASSAFTTGQVVNFTGGWP